MSNITFALLWTVTASAVIGLPATLVHLLLN